MSGDGFLPRAILVTGGAGFIGGNVVRWVLSNVPDVSVATLDLLTHAGNRESLADVEARHGASGDGRHAFVRGDIRDGALVARLLAGEATDADGRRIPAPDAVLHLAAETHVDRSILEPASFVSTNVLGTQVLLDAVRDELARSPRPFRFVHVSTDEVYGALAPAEPPAAEDRPLAPNSPYAASKAGADLLVRAAVETFGLPCLTTRCGNNYGPYQFPEKLVPLMITRALDGATLPVYGDGLHVRDWIHVEDHAAALWAVLTRGRLADRVYHVGAGTERANLDIVRAILAELGRPESLVAFVRDRPGHDRRYALDAARLRERTGWRPRHELNEGLRATVRWYVEHQPWWRRVQSEAYRAANALYLR